MGTQTAPVPNGAPPQSTVVKGRVKLVLVWLAWGTAATCLAMILIFFLRPEFSYRQLVSMEIIVAVLPFAAIGAVYKFIRPRLIRHRTVGILWKTIGVIILVGTAYVSLQLFSLGLIGWYAQTHSSGVIELFYITDREAKSAKEKSVEEIAEESEIFTNEPNSDDEILVGRAEVEIPWDREDSGVMLSRFRWHRASSKRLVRPIKMSTPDFQHLINEALRRLDQKDALVFVHGFHNPFDDAILTAGKLKYDLRFQGPVILYSWPSANSVLDYLHDYEAATWSAKHLGEMLLVLQKLPDIQRLQILAHSMGNLVLGDALLNTFSQPNTPSALFSDIVLAAPDVDEPTFRRFAPVITHVAKRTTLYVCLWDGALAASSGASHFARVGQRPEAWPGIDVIDTSPAAHIGLNHSYVFENNLVANDLFTVLEAGLPPSRRRRLYPSGNGHFVLR